MFFTRNLNRCHKKNSGSTLCIKNTYQKFNFNPISLSYIKDEEDMLGDSFTSFDQHCRVAIMEHRTRFIALKRESLDSLSNLLKFNFYNTV